MWCRKRQKEVTDKECSQCWQKGQKAIWRRRMIEDYGARPGDGHTAHILRRDCRLVNLFTRPEDCQRPIPKSEIME